MTDNFLNESHPWFVDVTQPSLLMRTVQKLWMLMVVVLVLGAFALITEAQAAPSADVYRASDNQGNMVRLFDEPCAVTKDWFQLKRAEFTYLGKKYEACWVIAQTTVLIFDSAGDVSTIPIAQFRKEETI